MPALRASQEELATRIVNEFTKIRPSLEAVAKGVTRNNEISVRMAKPGSASHTDGKVIYVQVPHALAEKPEHDRVICDRRDENFQLQCRACYRRELVLRNMFHEIGHVVENSFMLVGDTPYRQRTPVALPWVTPERQAHINYQLRSPGWGLTYRVLATESGKGFPMLANALEDVRIEAHIAAARPGAGLMFKSNAYNLVRIGVQGNDAQATDLFGDEEGAATKAWIDMPPNTQFMVGLIFKGAGTDVTGFLHPQVVADLAEVEPLIARARTCKTAGDTYRLTVEMYAEMIRFGYISAPPPPMPAEKDDDADQQSEDDKQAGQSDSEPDSDQQGSGDPEGDPDTAKSDSEHGQTDSSTDEQPDADTGAQGTGDESLENDGPDLSDDTSNDIDAPDPFSADDDTEDTPRPESSAADDETGDGTDTPAPDDEAGSDDTSPDSGDDSMAGTGADDSEPGETSTAQGGSDGQPGEPDDSDFGMEEGTDGTEEETEPYGDGFDSDGIPIYDPEDEATEAGTDDANRWGTAVMAEPDEISGALDNVLGHDNDGQVDIDAGDTEPETAVTETVLNRANEMAYRPSEFEMLGDRVSGVTYYTWTPSKQAWVNSRASGPIETGSSMNKGYVVDTKSYAAPESIMSSGVFQLRLVLEANAKGKFNNGRKSGKINPRVLGKRAPLDDPRLFRTRDLPKKKDYHVVLCMDCSGSTLGTTLDDEKRAVYAQAELLNRLGISFEIIAVTGYGRGGAGGMARDAVVAVFEVKNTNQAWNNATKDNLANVFSSSSNLDGHSLQVCISRALKVRVTDRIIMYYTDGEMPAANYDEELLVLKRGIATCAQQDITLMGVGLGTDSPRAHGLDTVRVDRIEDVPKAIEHLGKRIRA